MRFRAPQRLFSSYLLLILVLVVSLSLVADRLLRRQLVRTIEGDLRRELALASALRAASAGLDPDSMADGIARATGRRTTLVRRDGSVAGESTRDGEELRRMENHLSRPEIREALRAGSGASIRRSTTLRTDLLYVALLAPTGEVIRLAVPLAEVDAALGRVQRGIASAGAATLLLALLFSLGFSVAVMRPLRRVQAAASALAAGDLSIRLSERGGGELGELAGALDTLADQLQRRVAQLERERAQSQALIDAMSEGVVALAPDGTVSHANPAGRRMFGLSENFRSLGPEAVSRRPAFLQIVQRALAGETVHPAELVGDGRSLVATGHPLPDGGAVLVFLDTSELRRLESVRRDFVANASHELKTPLTAIRGYSETLLDPELPPPLISQFAATIKANADRLQRIVDDLLDLSRIESGGWVVKPEDVELAGVVEEAWSSQSLPFQDKRIALRLDIGPGAERVHGDPGALLQILCNLLSNALRYTPEGGSVTVRARRSGPRRRSSTSLPPAIVGGWVVVEVEDTGTGIPSVHLGRIFERFYRVDPARSRADGGTGLGLAIVKHLVEAHGGHVEAASQLARGTTIRFSLPAPA